MACEAEVRSPFLQRCDGRAGSLHQKRLPNNTAIQIENAGLHPFLSFRGASEWADRIRTRMRSTGKSKCWSLPAIPGD